MAVDFPSNPVHGQVFGTWTYDSTVPGWRSTPDVATGMPAGSIMVWGTDVAPTNWLICNGAAVSRSTYASLFAAIGVTYGVGDGATTFNLPDLRGKVAVGKDSTQAEFDLLGETGGNKATAKYGDGTTTGYGATYSSSLGSGDATGSNLPPYQIVNYIIKFSAGVSAGDSDLATRVGVIENKFNTGQNDAPAGSITQFAGTTIPTNWLLCDGSAVSRATWPSLYAAIGTTYGAGDGSTTFNLPDIPNGTAAGVLASSTLTSQISFSSTTVVDIDGLSVSANLRAGRSYRISLTSSQMSTSSSARMQIKFVVNGVSVDNHYFSNPGTYGETFNAETVFTPTTDLGTVTVKIQGIIDIGTGTFYFYADTTSKITFTVEDMGESPTTTSLRQKHIIKATAGIATNESAFVTRVGAVETVNDTQNTRLTNLEYHSPNAIINGAFDFWQRGTSFSNPSDSTFTADRWGVFYSGSGATRTISQQTFTPGAAPVAGYEGTYFLRFAQSVAGSGGSWNVLSQHVEDCRMFAGQTVTLSYWAKASSSITVTPDMIQRFGSGGSTEGYVALSPASVTTSWQRFSSTVTLPSISGKTIGPGNYLAVEFALPVNTTFTFDIWGVQLEAGSAASAFRRNSNSLQAELAACQRYYQKSYNIETAPGTSTGQGAVYSGAVTDIYGSGLYQLNFKVPMRATPTINIWTYTGTANLWSYNKSGSNLTTTSMTWDTASWGGNQGGMIYAPGLGVAYGPIYIIGQWTASAEL